MSYYHTQCVLLLSHLLLTWHTCTKDCMSLALGWNYFSSLDVVQ